MLRVNSPFLHVKLLRLAHKFESYQSCRLIIFIVNDCDALTLSKMTRNCKQDRIEIDLATECPFESIIQLSKILTQDTVIYEETLHGISLCDLPNNSFHRNDEQFGKVVGKI